VITEILFIHTCYVLSGLSSVQHQWTLHASKGEDNLFTWNTVPLSEPLQIFDETARLKPTHPIYVIPPESVDNIKAYFLAKVGF
jgi:protein farnesyltransferase subunit beta